MGKTGKFAIALRMATVAVVALVSSCASPTLLRQHPDYPEVARRIRTIAVLPPEVEHQRIVFSGDNERLSEREDAIARDLTRRLRVQLERRNYTVPGAEDEWPGDAKKNETAALRQLRAACNEAIKRLYAQGDTAATDQLRRVTVGPVANAVADQMQADALLLVRFASYEKSGGQQAKDMTSTILLGTLLTMASGGAVMPVNMPAKSGGVVQLVLIDGTTGDVLWANGAQGATDNRTTGRGWSRRTQSGMHVLIQSAVAGMPERVQGADPGSDVTPPDRVAH